MTPKHLCLLLLALVGVCFVTAQSEDELQIPVENDNQFPPDNHSDVIEGSGDGVIEEPDQSVGQTTEAVPPPIEHIEPKTFLDELGAAAPSEGEDLCPQPCVCHVEGSSTDFIVDCSGYELTEFPTPISEKTTILNVQKNKLTEIPKSISTLKNLKVLNANDNSIMSVDSGSVSELPALVTLKLGNNRLIDYPSDLKNSFGLIKLEELDLGGNDMRTPLTSDQFSKFESLRKLILPTSTPELPQDLCDALPKTLETVCTGTCDTEVFECRDEENDMTDDELPVLPGALLLPTESEENADPVVNTPEVNTETNDNTNSKTNVSPADTEGKTVAPVEFSFRSAINKQPSDEIAPFNSIVEAPKDISSSNEEPVKYGATTIATKTGGVDKSIIGLVVAGMVVIVAGITIKKNWSSIKKRFSSNNPTPNERNGINANGTPEEVPLQDKSPV
ncbi:uncharacterized protein LOC135075206 [Ostrinia nubilalis]|uniref:uncharacterized protein LOC135075206 n=1 Tax=Ostrinia nubilalis TaxID=29057 RepID=UPI00308241A6